MPPKQHGKYSRGKKNANGKASAPAASAAAPAASGTPRVDNPPPGIANGTPLTFENRHPSLPKVYELKYHPQAPKEWSGRIFLLYGDSSIEGLRESSSHLNEFDNHGDETGL
jgi:hypothetical protein